MWPDCIDPNHSLDVSSDTFQKRGKEIKIPGSGDKTKLLKEFIYFFCVKENLWHLTHWNTSRVKDTFLCINYSVVVQRVEITSLHHSPLSFHYCFETGPTSQKGVKRSLELCQQSCWSNICLNFTTCVLTVYRISNSDHGKSCYRPLRLRFLNSHCSVKSTSTWRDLYS